MFCLFSRIVLKRWRFLNSSIVSSNLKKMIVFLWNCFFPCHTLKVAGSPPDSQNFLEFWQLFEHAILLLDITVTPIDNFLLLGWNIFDLRLVDFFVLKFTIQLLHGNFELASDERTWFVVDFSSSCQFFELLSLLVEFGFFRFELCYYSLSTIQFSFPFIHRQFDYDLMF
jgi:hypothetical protein